MFYLDRGGLPTGAYTLTDHSKSAYKRCISRWSRLHAMIANLIYHSFKMVLKLFLSASCPAAPWMPPGTAWELPGGHLGLPGSFLGPHEMLQIQIQFQ